MTLRRITCFVVGCDDCRTDLGGDCRTDLSGEDLGYIVHFDTDRDALDHLAANGWTIRDDGHLRCPGCSARYLCAHLDHLWDVWHVCCCHGAIPRHHTGGCPLIRSCTQCGALDEATLAHLPTTDEPNARGC